MTRDAGTSEPFDASTWVGRVVEERYRIERVLGEGGMGAVFAAEHLKLRKPVALKVILPELAGDPELAQRFAREAMVSAKLDHPHVASALDYGALPDGGAYLVMQLARGRALRALVHPPGDWRLALQLGAQIADALAAAHAQGIVHRDLKPENVVVEEREGSLHARVLDFGIARLGGAAAPDTGALTRVGAIMGTPGYMAPEQALGESVDARADVYALGVIFWELAVGRALFEQDELGAIVAAQLTGAAPRLSSRIEGVPAPLDALVARMLEPTKTQRPASGGEVRDALRAIATEAGISLHARAPTLSEASAPVLADARTELASGATLTTELTGARAAAPSIARPAPGTTLISPRSRALRDLGLLGGVAAGLLAAVALSCLASRFACAADPGVAGTTPAPAPSAPAPVVATPVAPRAARPAAPLALVPVPPELAPDLTVLETHPEAALRAAAAARLAPRVAELPGYARALLAYETGAECDDRREAILAMRVLGDPRAIPALHRIAATPRSGCGRRGRSDCDRCLRRDLDRTLERLAGRDAD